MEKLIELIQFLFLGLFQGFTEPIPISSSGHLVMLQDLFGVDLPGLSFEVFVNFGSLIAVVIIYRNDLIRLASNGLAYLFKQNREANVQEDFRFIMYLLIATIPAGVIGLLFEDWIEGTFSSAKMVGITLIITGIALWIIRNLRGTKGDHDLNWKAVIIVGLAQAVALIPGISRSGATIVAAMLLGWKQETALRFSFMLFIPVSAGTLLLDLNELFNNPNIIPYLVAFMASIIATYFSLRWFMNIMAKGNLKYFSFYCFIVGALAFLLL
ncbi:undecaprenyl-diphosphate phosphatase [Pontibacillus litoralis]|uniref:Undecaprenyl-diphosphatase n=1 Tax=Pontibacillus litoralis JSM 072002 TaxID=1385512 RepID=A0A0A5G981_9BACI|nr:undecaprenyl-diphosphate phosphatase [Pontibacillus litoralis]KGX87738.1 UDP pyrophosphate phosphatase [Pontibacillus litoralis JSM 072002]